MLKSLTLSATVGIAGGGGWKLVARKFTYSRLNTWDTPPRAFVRGRGHCEQQALALKAVYDALGIQTRDERDVCPGSVENTPGHPQFRALSPCTDGLPGCAPSPIWDPPSRTSVAISSRRGRAQ
jgi:hypothetical protein